MRLELTIPDLQSGALALGDARKSKWHRLQSVMGHSTESVKEKSQTKVCATVLERKERFELSKTSLEDSHVSSYITSASWSAPAD